MGAEGGQLGTPLILPICSGCFKGSYLAVLAGYFRCRDDGRVTQAQNAVDKQRTALQ